MEHSYLSETNKLNKSSKLVNIYLHVYAGINYSLSLNTHFPSSLFVSMVNYKKILKYYLSKRLVSLTLITVIISI